MLLLCLTDAFKSTSILYIVSDMVMTCSTSEGLLQPDWTDGNNKIEIENVMVRSGAWLDSEFRFVRTSDPTFRDICDVSEFLN